MNKFVTCNHVLSFKVNGGRSAVLTQGYYLSEKSLEKHKHLSRTRKIVRGCHKFSRTLKKKNSTERTICHLLSLISFDHSNPVEHYRTVKNIKKIKMKPVHRR